MSPSRPHEGHTRGFIVPIGGAEDKVGDETILKRLVSIAGGRSARVVVIPTASESRHTGRDYEKLFRALRAEDVNVLAFDSRKECEEGEALALLERANVVFLTGGNQLRLSTTLGGTPVARLLRRMNAAGVHMAGTSAGAAFLCEHMIAFGDEGATPRGGMVSLVPGLGLTNRVVVDQHFRQRDRLGRLITALAYNPFVVGLGLDEDTAAFLGPDEVFEVVGSGAITVIDPGALEFSSIDAARRGDPVSLINLRMHVLVQGGTLNLLTREATAERAGKAED